MIRSVRFSLTLLHLGILALILCVFSSLLYSTVQSALFRSIDLLLATQADGIEGSIYSFWKAESQNPSHTTRVLHRFQDEAAAGHFPQLILRWAKETDELDTQHPVRVLSREGTALAFAPIFKRWAIPVNREDLQKSTRPKKIYDTYMLPDHKRVRVLTYPVIQKGHILYFVQAAILLHQADMSAERLRDWLLVFIPTTLILTSLIGWFLASLILKPIDKMTRQAHALSESRLHERLDVPTTGDELTRLAVTFNEMLDRFERGFKRLRQFSAAASHELRTPLTVIKGEMELALLKPRSEDEYRRVLQSQVNVVNDMVHVVEQLLAVAHAEDGELAVNWETLNLCDLVRGVTQSYTKWADEKAIILALHTEQSVFIKGEKSLLERLIANLLENALRHTPQHGRVALEVTLWEAQARLMVTDTGKGISDEEMPKIFQKFFDRKKTPGNTVSTGIGLGLCRWIAELHKGVIEASHAPAGGARFMVTFPVLLAAGITGAGPRGHPYR